MRCWSANQIASWLELEKPTCRNHKSRPFQTGRTVVSRRASQPERDDDRLYHMVFAFDSPERIFALGKLANARALGIRATCQKVMKRSVHAVGCRPLVYTRAKTIDSATSLESRRRYLARHLSDGAFLVRHRRAATMRGCTAPRSSHMLGRRLDDLAGRASADALAPGYNEFRARINVDALISAILWRCHC